MTDLRSLINRDRLVDRFVALCRTDSASYRERALCDQLQAQLAELGCQLYEDGAGAAVHGDSGNLLARLPGTRPGPAVLLAAHMDRWQGGTGVRPVLTDGLITSDGSTVLGADDAAGLAAALEALAVLQEHRLPHPDVELAFTVCEEEGVLGARHLEYGWLTTTLGYCLDGEGDVGTAIVQSPHRTLLQVAYTGTAGHTLPVSEPKGTAMQMVGWALAHMKLGRIDHQTTALVGEIREGDAGAGTASLRAEARSTDRGKLAAQVAHMTDCFGRAAARFAGSVQVTADEGCPGFRVDQQAPVLLRALRAMARLGLAPLVQGTGAASDANLFNSHGIPCLVLGAGYQQIHTTAEAMPVPQLLDLAALALAVVLEDD